MNETLGDKVIEFNLDEKMRYNPSKILQEFSIVLGSIEIKSAKALNSLLIKNDYLLWYEGVKRLSYRPEEVELEHILSSAHGSFVAYTPKGVMFILGLVSVLGYHVTHKATGKDIKLGFARICSIKNLERGVSSVS